MQQEQYFILILEEVSLSESIKENLIDVAFNYSNLEFNLAEKQRGSRYVHLIDIINVLQEQKMFLW